VAAAFLVELANQHPVWVSWGWFILLVRQPEKEVGPYSQGEAWPGEKAKSNDDVARNPVVEAMQCSICIDTVLPASRSILLVLILILPASNLTSPRAQMHRCTALLPCLHSMCAGCASKALAVSDRCPTCRAPVEGAQPNLAMRGMIESVCSAEPSRKRKVEETVELDRDELALAGHVDRIVTQRGGNADSIRQVVRFLVGVGAGDSPLMAACAEGRVEVVQELLAVGTNANQAYSQVLWCFGALFTPTSPISRTSIGN